MVDGVVYATSVGGTYALDADTGEVLWYRRRIRAHSSPTYDDGNLFVHTSPGKVISIDAATGEATR